MWDVVRIPDAFQVDKDGWRVYLGAGGQCAKKWVRITKMTKEEEKGNMTLLWAKAAVDNSSWLHEIKSVSGWSTFLALCLQLPAKIDMFGRRQPFQNTRLGIIYDITRGRRHLLLHERCWCGWLHLTRLKRVTGGGVTGWCLCNLLTMCLCDDLAEMHSDSCVHVCTHTHTLSAACSDTLRYKVARFLSARQVLSWCSSQKSKK